MNLYLDTCKRINNEPKQSLREEKSLTSVVKTSLRTYFIKGRGRETDREGGERESVNKCYSKEAGICNSFKVGRKRFRTKIQ